MDKQKSDPLHNLADVLKENFSLRYPIDLKFSAIDVNKAFEERMIDEIDRDFLINALNQYVAGNRQVITDIMTYRMQLNNDLKPGQERFIRMQELGCKNHPHTGLNISGYELPEVDLKDSNFGGNIKMLCTKTNGMINLSHSNIKGEIEVDDVKTQRLHMDGMRAKRLHFILANPNISLGKADIEEDITFEGCSEKNVILDDVGLKINGKKLTDEEKDKILPR